MTSLSKNLGLVSIVLGCLLNIFSICLFSFFDDGYDSLAIIGIVLSYIIAIFEI